MKLQEYIENNNLSSEWRNQIIEFQKLGGSINYLNKLD